MNVTYRSISGEQLLLLTIMGRPTQQAGVQRELHRRSLFGLSYAKPAPQPLADHQPAARRSALLAA